MEFSLACVLFCSAIFIHGSKAQCKAGENTYQVGAVWREDIRSDCIQHTCREDGTFDTTRCDPAHVVTQKLQTSITVSSNKPSVKTDSLFNYSLPGCAVEDKVVKVGDQYDLPGRCFYRACVGNDQWIMKACGLIGLTPGFILTPEDASKPYPACCGRAVPLLDVVPDVIQELQWSVLLDITYDELTVNYGNELTPAQVKKQPLVNYKADPAAWYLLCMVDPDAPSREDPKNREFLHWLVGNIPGSYVVAGEVLADYVGAGPPKDTGLHRYVFVLYKQLGKLSFSETKFSETSSDNRRKFSVSKLAQKYSLGDPISFNFFQAKWDDYVPIVHQQLGIN